MRRSIHFHWTSLFSLLWVTVYILYFASVAPFSSPGRTPATLLFSSEEELTGTSTARYYRWWEGAEAATTSTTQPKVVVRFAALLDNFFPTGEHNVAVGVEAAFKEANDTELPLGPDIKLRIDIIDGSAGYQRTDNANMTLFQPIVESFNLTANAEDLTGYVALSFAMGANLGRFHAQKGLVMPPAYGSRLVDSLIMRPTNFNLRGSVFAEYAHLTDFMLHHRDHHCTRLLMLVTGEVPPVKYQVVLDAFAASGFAAPRVIRRDVATEASGFNGTMIVEYLRGRPDTCIFVADYAHVMPRLLADLLSSGLDLSHYPIFSTSSIVPASFASVRAALPFLYVSNIVPDFHNTSRELSRRAVAAVNALLVENRPRPPRLSAFFTNAMTHNHMEGYVVGRAIIRMLSATVNNITRADVLKAAFEIPMIIDDLVLAPLSNRCVDGVNLPCFCNIAGKSFFMLRGNSSSASFHEVRDDDSLGETELATRTGSLSECLESGIQPRRAFNIISAHAVIAEAATVDAPYAAGLLNFKQALQAGLRYWNLEREFRLRGGLRLIDIPVVTAANATTVVQAAEARYRPFAVLGAQGTDTQFSLSLAPTLLKMRVVDYSPAAWRPNTFHLEASLAHYMHALVGTLHETESRAPHVVASTTTIADLCVRSLHTFGRQAASVSVLTDPAATATLVVQRLRGQGLVLFATIDTTAIGATITSIAASTAGLTATQTGGGTLLLAASEVDMQHAKDAFGTAPWPPSTAAAAVRFASIHVQWWANETGTTQGDALFAATGLRSTTDVAMLKGVYYAEAVHALAAGALTFGNGIGGTQTVAALSSFTAAGVTIGPIYTAPCGNKNSSSSSNTQAAAALTTAMTPNRQCQCDAGPRHVHVHSFADWQAGTMPAPAPPSTAGTGAYIFSGCSIEYSTLVSARTDNTALLVGAVAGSAGGALSIMAGVLIALLCCVGRSHRHAPKDPNKPFAIVFTDIQGSTSLWARLPAIMSEAVDQHHRILRKLIAQHKGYEVKTVGDSFMVAFEDPEPAAAFAVAIQRAFMQHQWPVEIDGVYKALAMERAEEEDTVFDTIFLAERAADYAGLWRGLRVRIGIHFGLGIITKDETSGGYDYYGTVVNTAARIEGVGHGGQTLLSKDVYDAFDMAFAADTLRADPLPLGTQSLRGLDVPIPIIQLLPMELAGRTFPKLRLEVDGAADVEHLDSDTGSVQSSSSPSPTRQPGAATVGGTTTSAESRSFLESVAKHHGGRVPLEELALIHSATTLLFASSPVAWQRATLRSLMRRWHVAEPRMSASEGVVGPEQLLQRSFAVLLGKVLKAQKSAVASSQGADRRCSSHVVNESASPTTSASARFLNLDASSS